jgi:hypothetical protein
MVYNSQGLLRFRTLSGILKNTTFRKLDLLLSFSISPEEIDPVSEILCSIEYRTMDKVQKRMNPEIPTFYTEDGGNRFIRNVRKYIRGYTMSHSRRQ